MYKIFVLVVVLGLAAADHIDKDAEVRSLSSNVNPDGTYEYQYETSNGINAQESGTGGVVATGSASWVDPEGTQIQLSYVADENGFQPSGSHLPVPPEVPEAILRSLAWNAAHPEEDESQTPQKRF